MPLPHACVSRSCLRLMGATGEIMMERRTVDSFSVSSRAFLQVLLALGRCHGDIMIANEAVETVETAAKIPQCVAMTAEVS